MGHLDWFNKPRGKVKEVKSNTTNINNSNTTKVVLNVSKQGNKTVHEAHLDDSYEHGGSSGKTDANVISNVVQEVMKVLKKSNATNNFAGISLFSSKNDIRNV